MNDKPLAGILTAVIAAPLVLVCCGGAVFIIPFVSSFASWLGGLDIISALMIGLVIASGITGIRRWFRRTHNNTLIVRGDE
jgi:hypothetical protein